MSDISTYRWLYFKTQKSFDELSNVIAHHKFSDNSKMGVQLYFSSTKLIHAKYIEEITFYETITNHSGDIKKIPIKSFNHLEFKIRKGVDNLEIISPPRQLSNFVNFLCKITDYETSIARLKINIKDFISHLESNTKIKVTTMRCRGISLAGDIKADMKISGTNDIRSKVKQYIPSATLSSATINLIELSPAAKITISDTSYLKVTNCNQFEISDLLYEAIKFASPIYC